MMIFWLWSTSARFVLLLFVDFVVLLFDSKISKHRESKAFCFLWLDWLLLIGCFWMEQQKSSSNNATTTKFSTTEDTQLNSTVEGRRKWGLEVTIQCRFFILWWISWQHLSYDGVYGAEFKKIRRLVVRGWRVPETERDHAADNYGRFWSEKQRNLPSRQPTNKNTHTLILKKEIHE